MRGGEIPHASECLTKMLGNTKMLEEPSLWSNQTHFITASCCRKFWAIGAVSVEEQYKGK
eukprot:175692-Pelagomonas_calceolata.AAC.1